jgi:hypothetical protein
MIKLGAFVKFRYADRIRGRVTRVFRLDASRGPLYRVRTPTGPMGNHFERDLIPLEVVEIIALLLEHGKDFARPRRKSRRKPLFPGTGHRQSER